MGGKRFLVVAGWMVGLLAFLHWLEPGFWRGAGAHYHVAAELAEEGRPGEALEALDRALRERPRDPGFLRFEGHLSLELEEPADASEAFRASLQDEPEHPDALLGLARAELGKGESVAARRALERLPDELPGPEEELERARLLHRAGDSAGALARYRDLAEEHPRHAFLLEEGAAVAEMEEAWEVVQELFGLLAKVAVGEEARRDALERRARALRAADRREEAWAVYGEVAGPENLRERAALALELGRYGEAAELHGELADAGRAQREDQEARAYALERAGRPTEAARVYRDLLGETPDEGAVRVSLVHVLNRLERYGEAWEALQATQAPADDGELLRLQARTAHWAGEDEAASELLEAWARRTPDHPEPLRLLAENRRRVGDSDGHRHALRRYVERAPADGRARLDLARLVTEGGGVGEAIVHYHEALERFPDSPAILEELAAILEEAGEPEMALRRYRQALEVRGESQGTRAGNPEAAAIRVTVARLHAGLEEWDEAARAYREALEGDATVEGEGEVTLELAEVLLEAERAEEALERVRPLADRYADDAGVQLQAARAAAGAGRPEDEVRYLERLRDARPLTGAEERWLAGRYRAAGEPAEALEAYEVLADDHPDDAELLLAVGDLRQELGDPDGALEAYAAIPENQGGPEAALGEARARAATGDRSGALEAYDAYLEARPDDPETLLEAARTRMAAGRSEEAVAGYERYVQAEGESGLGVELARAYLAAGHFEAAEALARRAHARGESPAEALLARAHALRELGRVREERRVLEHLAEAPAPADDPTWPARLAEARNRPLTAFFHAREALEDSALEDAGAGELLLLQARVLGSRGDVARAAAALEEAVEAGVDTARARRTLDGFRGATRGALTLPALHQHDRSGLSLPQAGAVLQWPVAGRLRLQGTAVGGRIRQGEVSFERWALALAADRWFPSARLELRGGGGVEDYGAGGRVVVGHGEAVWSPGGGREAGLRLERTSLWSEHDDFRPRGWNRVRRMEGLGPAFILQSTRAHFVSRGTSARETRVEAGVTHLEDGNRQLAGHAHRQYPLPAGRGRSMALRPNLYLESFAREVDAYASPSFSAALGLGLHGALEGEGFRRGSGFRVEAELNPSLLWVDDDVGPGGSGMVEVTRSLGRARVGATLFGYLREPEDYALWRGMVRLRLPLGGGEAP